MIYEERVSGDWVNAFRRQGLVVVRGFHTDKDCIEMLDLFHRVFQEEGIDPTQPHNLIGVQQRYRFLWPSVVDGEVTELLRHIVGGDVHYAEESKIGTGSVTHGWHRDDGHIRTTSLTKDQLDAQGYVRLRVLRYIREADDPNSVVCFRPGTHRRDSDYGEFHLEVRPADLVVFNALVVHQGTNPSNEASKYISTTTYGNSIPIAKDVYRHNSRSRFHERYYRMTDELLQLLAAHRLAPLTLQEKHALDHELGVT